MKKEEKRGGGIHQGEMCPKRNKKNVLWHQQEICFKVSLVRKALLEAS